jgi:hypothetical protein
LGDSSLTAGLTGRVSTAVAEWRQRRPISAPRLLGRFVTRFYLVTALASIATVLTVITFAQLRSTIAAIVYPYELQYGEAVIYDHAARVLRAEPLYQPLDRAPFTVVAYTPVYYWAAAGMRVIFGSGFGPGRSLSCLAGVGAASLVGYLVAREARSRWAGLFAGLLFLALGLPAVYPRADLFYRDNLATTAWANFSADLTPLAPWMAFYKEDVLGVALALGSIATIFGGTSTRRLVLGGVLAALAILTKQTLVAASIAGLVWLWRRDPRQGALFGGVCLTTVALSCASLEFTTGAFFANTVLANLNPLRLDVLVSNIGLLGRFQGGLLLVAGLYVVRRTPTTPDERNELLVYYWAASALPLLGLAKVGSNHNHWIEFGAATSMMATLGIWSRLDLLREQPTRTLVPVVLFVATVALATIMQSRSAPVLFGGPPQLDPSVTRQYDVLIERVRQQQGAVLASSLDVVALADRSILLEPYVFSVLYTQGQWDPGPLIRRICGRQIQLLVFYNPLEYGTGLYHGYAFWPAPVIEALQETMALEAIQAGRFLYVPKPPAAAPNRPAIAAGRVCAD